MGTTLQALKKLVKKLNPEADVSQVDTIAKCVDLVSEQEIGGGISPEEVQDMIDTSIAEIPKGFKLLSRAEVKDYFELSTLTNRYVPKKDTIIVLADRFGSSYDTKTYFFSPNQNMYDTYGETVKVDSSNNVTIACWNVDIGGTGGFIKYFVQNPEGTNHYTTTDGFYKIALSSSGGYTVSPHNLEVYWGFYNSEYALSLFIYVLE